MGDMVRTRQKVPVSMRALVQRINRALAKSDRILKIARGARARFDLGEFFVIDLENRFVVAKFVDPVKWARELGVLQSWEKLEE
jgi:hypothetical protein